MSLDRLFTMFWAVWKNAKPSEKRSIVWKAGVHLETIAFQLSLYRDLGNCCIVCTLCVSVESEYLFISFCRRPTSGANFQDMCRLSSDEEFLVPVRSSKGKLLLLDSMVPVLFRGKRHFYGSVMFYRPRIPASRRAIKLLLNSLFKSHVCVLAAGSVQKENSWSQMLKTSRPGMRGTLLKVLCHNMEITIYETNSNLFQIQTVYTKVYSELAIHLFDMLMLKT